MIRHSGILTLTATASLLLVASMFSSVHAYGNTAQWQIAISATCNAPSLCGPPGGTGTFGVWGWCEFGGSSGSTAASTTGTSGDCQVTHYGRTDVGQPINPTHIAADITGWTISPSPMSPTGFSFHLTSFSLECTGPGASSPVPFTGCSVPPGGDTGIPPNPGHYSMHPFPGFEFNIQVNQLP